jgi:hypothetical protein
MKSGYSIGADGIPLTKKDPTAVLDFPFGWGPEWLQVGEHIAAGTAAVMITPSGLNVDSYALDDTGTIVIVWLSGGAAGVTYRVAVKVTTDQGRTDTRSINVSVERR